MGSPTHPYAVGRGRTAKRGQGAPTGCVYRVQPMRTSDKQFLFCYTTTRAGADDTPIICSCSLCFFLTDSAHVTSAAQPLHKCSQIACGASLDFIRVFTLIWHNPQNALIYWSRSSAFSSVYWICCRS